MDSSYALNHLLNNTEETYLPLCSVHFVKGGFNSGNGNNMFKFMLTILGAVAEMERELTLERIREGMAKAKIYDTKSSRPVGRPLRQIPPSFKKYYPMWKDGEIAATDFARLIGVSRPTLYKYVREYKTEQ